MIRSFTALVVTLLLSTCSAKDGPSSPQLDAGAVSGVAPVDAAVARPAAATFASLEGTVTVLEGGAGTPVVAKVGGPLFDGDVVETGAASSARLRFMDGREVELQQNGRFEVGGTGGEVTLEVGQGVVVSRGGGPTEGSAVSLTIDTPFGLVRVGSAGLSVNVAGEAASVDVLAGAVTLVGREGEAISLESGEGGALTKQGATRRLEPLTIVLSQGTGRIELKRKDGKTFAVVNPKKAPTLAPGDTLRVAQGSATLTPAKSDARLTLLSGTEIGVGESARTGGAEDLALEVKKGTLQLALPFGKKRTIRPGEGLTVVAEQGGQVSIVRGRNGLELNSVVGDLAVTIEGGASVVVKGGQSATVTKAGVEAKDATREALVLPARGTVRLLHPGPERVAIDWPGEKDKAYRVVVGTEPGLERPFIDGIVHQTFLNVLAPARGLLVWKVLDGETEIARGSASCGPERLSDELGGITNEVPAGPDKTVIYFQDKPPALSFTWKAADKPVAEYQLRVYRAGALSAPLQEKRVPGPQAQLPLGSLTEGTYQWDVTWLDGTGAAIGTSGKMNQLELHYDNAVRAILIKSPRNGDPLTGKVAIAGIAPLGVRVTANGQGLTLDEKARFTGQVTPLPGGRVAFRVLQQGVDTFVVRWLGKGGAR